MYNHPGHDARLVLVGKLQALRTASNEENERLARIMQDLESLPSRNLRDVVAYNEHNHQTKEGDAEEKRRAAVEEAVKRWNEKHELVDKNLLVIQARIDELANERQAREAHRDLPTPEDQTEMAVEEAETAHRANMERVALIEVCMCLGSSALAVNFTECSECSRSIVGFRANDHLCGVGPPQGWPDPNPRGIAPGHGWPSSTTTRVR